MATTQRFAKIGTPLVVGTDGQPAPQAFNAVLWEGESSRAAVKKLLGSDYRLAAHKQTHKGQKHKVGEKTGILAITTPMGGVEYVPVGSWVSVKDGTDHQLMVVSEERMGREYVALPT